MSKVSLTVNNAHELVLMRVNSLHVFILKNCDANNSLRYKIKGKDGDDREIDIGPGLVHIREGFDLEVIGIEGPVPIEFELIT